MSKLDILGAHHNEVLITAKERISQEQVKLTELTQRVTDQNHACSGSCLEDCLEAQASLEAQDLLKQHQMASHPGFVIAFDNIDLELKVKNMTMSKQNRDIHWVNQRCSLIVSMEIHCHVMVPAVICQRYPTVIFFQA